MITQQKKEERNVTELFYEAEQQNIDKLNEIFGNVTLNRSEEQALLWLAGWEQGLVKNIISAFRKVEILEPEAQKHRKANCDR